MNLKSYLGLSGSEKMEYFFKTNLPTNRTWEYYVNWNNAISNTEQIEISLNTLNYLIGKQDIREKAVELFTKQPDLLKAIPILLAVRTDSKVTSIPILNIENDNTLTLENYDFKDINKENIEGYISFLEKVGLLEFLRDFCQKSLVDYVYGVEVGIGSNGRKNRSGFIMESIVKKMIEASLSGLEFELIEQATTAYIEEHWGVKVPSDKAKRRFDFAIHNKKNNKVILVETNFYSGGGSKLKSVSGEFIELHNMLQGTKNVDFVWITDGKGWFTSKSSLAQSMEKIEKIFNLNMLKEDFIKDIFLEG